MRVGNYHKKTNEEFLNECKLKRNDSNEYEFLEEYNGMNSPIKIKHLICGSEYEIRPGNFLYLKSTCKKCQLIDQKKKVKKIGKANLYTSEKYQRLFEKQSESKYELLTNYINSKTKITIKCKQCGRVYSVLPTTFQHGYRCASCSCKNTNEEFLKKAAERDDFDEYQFLSEYQGYDKKIKIKHICGNEYEVLARQFLNGNKCKKCALSFSNKAKAVEKYLNEKLENQFNILKEICFEDLKNEKYLRFDFGIFSKNNKLLSLIEFDGEQHTQPRFGEEKLKKQQHNDLLKNIYCEKNNIPLLRISYENFKNTYKEKIDNFLSSTTIEIDNFKLKDDSLVLNIMSRVSHKKKKTFMVEKQTPKGKI